MPETLKAQMIIQLNVTYNKTTFTTTTAWIEGIRVACGALGVDLKVIYGFNKRLVWGVKKVFTPKEVIWVNPEIDEVMEWKTD